MTDINTQEITNWLLKYVNDNDLDSFIVGVSGGVDSAVTSTLCAETGKPTIVINIPIKSSPTNSSLSTQHCNWLQAKYPNVVVHECNLTRTFNTLKVDLASAGFSENLLALANSKSRLRMILRYYLATAHSGVVVGTGNKVEDFGVGFYTKYGDGGVDISPIADLTKTQVREAAKSLGVLGKIITAPPTDGLWEDSRTDEEQIGASYEELEWAMDYVDNNKNDHLEPREKEVLDIFLDYRERNAHKMNPIPIFKLGEVQ